MATVVHIAAFKLKANSSKEDITKLDDVVKAFKSTIPGVMEAYAGPLFFC